MKIIYLKIILLIAVSCSVVEVNESKIIRIQGSDTMLYLNLKLAEKFMIDHPNISVYVEGGGSAKGINALINSEIDICASSRPLDPEEVRLFAERFNSVGMSFLIAKDALSIFINEKNPVRNISMNKLAKIFTCEITNWRELGGKDAEISLASRPPSSGTYGYFKKHVLLDQEFCNQIISIPTTKQIVEFVKLNENAIGYGGVGYGDESIEAKINNQPPYKVSSKLDNYPLTRYLRYYTPNKVSGVAKKYLDWVISEKGQNIVREIGFIPLIE
jgi:phosphate transport system substrate-binding protein